MTELLVTLNFACHTCAGPVQVTLRCEGPAPALAAAVAAVEIPCPHCGQVNVLTFAPNGTVHGVAPAPADPRRLPRPSLN